MRLQGRGGGGGGGGELPSSRSLLYGAHHTCLCIALDRMSATAILGTSRKGTFVHIKIQILRLK